MSDDVNGPGDSITVQHSAVANLVNSCPYAITAIAIVAVLFLALYNLTSYPTTWFDEGSHLHVPKTLVRFGVYADYSSEGFRHYGPTVGVGPTVMLPIAAAFRLLGIGLLQARLVMVVYLMATVLVFYRLAYELGGRRMAWVAMALLISSRGVSLLEYGRQVLGEVPGLLFLTSGLGVWFVGWRRADWRRLMVAGLLLGLATITKNQYLLVLAPSLGLAWIANLLYYRTAPHRVFIVPGIIVAVCFALWQVYMILYLGPATASENLESFRVATAGAAMVFSPSLMKRGVSELLSHNVYLAALLPVLMYGSALALPRQREAQRWGVLLILVVVNLVWYVVGSISWLRYAFPGLAIASLFVARFFHDMTDGFRLDWKNLRDGLSTGQAFSRSSALRGAMLIWLAAMILLPLGQTVRDIVAPPFNAPAAMAAYLDENVPRDALIETWEPEMGFLTDHNYHFPPPLLLNTAVGYVWLGGSPPSQEYDFVEAHHPDWVLVGEFSRWVDVYPRDTLQTDYRLVTSIGAYELYGLK
ncbi:MAG: glycosyl transferase [Chloroflexi bacterium]|nr:glycosyl transferase [Chloroflexota bacterium]